MTAASVRARWSDPDREHAATEATVGTSRPDPLSRLSLVLDRELVGVRRHRLDVSARVPASVARYVDASQGMIEFVFAGEAGPVVLAIAPGARGDTIVPVLPAPADEDDDGVPLGRFAPFDEVLGDALEDLDRVVGHVERPDEMRGLVLHLGGRMLMVYADLWELRVTLLP